MSGVRMRRGLVAVIGLTLLTGALFVPASEQTDAAFTDAEHASAAMQALTVPTPVAWGDPQCNARTVLLLGAELTFRWRVPPGFTGYTVADAQYGHGVSGVIDQVLGTLLGSVSTTGTPEAYTTVVSGGLLSGLLGGSRQFAVRLVGPGDWTSHWLVANASYPLLVGTGTCSVSVVPGY